MSAEVKRDRMEDVPESKDPDPDDDDVMAPELESKQSSSDTLCSASSTATASSSSTSGSSSSVIGVPSVTALQIGELKSVYEATKMLAKLKSEFIQYHRTYPSTPLHQKRFTQRQAVCLWKAHNVDWNIARGGHRNTNDLLFVAVCVEAVCRDPNGFRGAPDVLAEKWNTQRMLMRVKKAALNWRTGTIEEQELDRLLKEITAFTVYGYERLGFEAVLEITRLRYNYVRNPFKEIVPDADNSATLKKSFEIGADGESGETSEERAAYKRKELQIYTEAAVQLTASEFLQWCTRIFFELFFVRQQVLEKRFVAFAAEAKQHSESKEFPQWLEAHSNAKLRENGRKWLKNRCGIQQTAEFLENFREMSYRLVLVPGAIAFHQRSPQEEALVLKSSEYFNKDCDDPELSESYHRALDLSVEEIDKKADHPFRETMAFMMFAEQLKNDTTNTKGAVEVWKEYVLLEDQLVARFDQLSLVTRCLVPIRPRFVNVRGRWHILHKQKLFECADALHAITTWLLTMRDCFNNDFEDRRKVPKRLNEMFFNGQM